MLAERNEVRSNNPDRFETPRGRRIQLMLTVGMDMPQAMLDSLVDLPQNANEIADALRGGNQYED